MFKPSPEEEDEFIADQEFAEACDCQVAECGGCFVIEAEFPTYCIFLNNIIMATPAQVFKGYVTETEVVLDAPNGDKYLLLKEN